MFSAENQFRKPPTADEAMGCVNVDVSMKLLGVTYVDARAKDREA